MNKVVSNMSNAVIGLQMLFVAFGALVLVPLLTGLDPNVALFTAGVGTLIFQLVTRFQVPVFLGSSFAFIAPIIFGVQHWGLAATLGGLVCAGLLYVLISLLISFKGSEILHRLFPPIVTGPVIMVIGLVLAPIAVNMAMGRTGDGSAILMAQDQAQILSLFTLCATLVILLFARAFVRTIQIMLGLVMGYTLAFMMGVIDFSPVMNAAWFSVPEFTYPEFKLEAILYIFPIALVPLIEHFGDMVTISSVAKKDFLKKPGIHRTILGDGLATSFAGLVGGPPNTTYSEVTGAVALTRSFNPMIMTWAAIFAIFMAFCEKCGVFLKTIPVPVMGGLLLIIFGTITVVGLNQLVHAKEDLLKPKNLIIIALILVFGIGGMVVEMEQIMTLKGIGLAAITGVILNLILPDRQLSYDMK